MKPKKLGPAVYGRRNPVAQARFFLGKRLVVQSPEGRCAALITETEAYGGAEDRACHGFNNRRTARTETLFAPGGIAYVYLCYGLHCLLNFVTGPADVPMAVLIRAVHITEGKDLAARRRPGIPEARWASGPGLVCQALGITRADNGTNLNGKRIWVEDIGVKPKPGAITAGPRVGVAYAGEWAAKPWRFIWKPEQQKTRSG